MTQWATSGKNTSARRGCELSVEPERQVLAERAVALAPEHQGGGADRLAAQPVGIGLDGVRDRSVVGQSGPRRARLADGVAVHRQVRRFEMRHRPGAA